VYALVHRCTAAPLHCYTAAPLHCCTAAFPVEAIVQIPGATAMDLIDRLRELSARIPRQLKDIQTEEATKHMLVLPFLAALGYNVSDPMEVTAEWNADVAVRKGDTVDHAILREGKPVLLIECRHYAVDLAYASALELYRCFSVTEARLGLFTNGVKYWFYTDLEAPNKMDAKPFFEFNLLDVRDNTVEELKKFSKPAFDLNAILTTATALKYTREIRRVLQEQLQQPSDEFVKLVTAEIYTGRMTHAVKEQFAQLTHQAFVQLVNDQINERLKFALRQSSLSRTL
jgi:hypothetical protein